MALGYHLSTIKGVPMTTRTSVTVEGLASFIDSLELTVPETMTGYYMANLVNRVLGTEMRPQMVYQYIVKGKISKSENMIQSVDGDKGRVVTRDEFFRWTSAYAARHGINLPGPKSEDHAEVVSETEETE